MSRPVQCEAFMTPWLPYIEHSFLSPQLTAVTRGHHPRACRFAFSFLLGAAESRCEGIAFRPPFLCLPIAFLALARCHSRREHELSSSSSSPPPKTRTRIDVCWLTRRAHPAAGQPGTRPATKQGRVICIFAQRVSANASLIKTKSLFLRALRATSGTPIVRRTSD